MAIMAKHGERFVGSRFVRQTSEMNVGLAREITQDVKGADAIPLIQGIRNSMDHIK
jgi:hypothetical protein